MQSDERKSATHWFAESVVIIIRLGQGERDTQMVAGNEFRCASLRRQPAIGTGLHEAGGAENLSPRRERGER